MWKPWRRKPAENTAKVFDDQESILKRQIDELRRRQKAEAEKERLKREAKVKRMRTKRNLLQYQAQDRSRRTSLFTFNDFNGRPIITVEGHVIASHAKKVGFRRIQVIQVDPRTLKVKKHGVGDSLDVLSI